MRCPFKSTFVLAFLFALAAGRAFCQEIAITGPDRSGLLEGEKYTITWAADGMQSVSMVAHGALTRMGAKSRGSFQLAIAEGVSAKLEEVRWTVPWIDSATFFVKAKGYDSLGRQVVADERRYDFRPAFLAKRTKDGIYLDLRWRTKQRLYVQKKQRITYVYLSSSSEDYLWLPPGRHLSKPHDHAGAFKVLEKKRLHWSSLFRVKMPWAMRYHGGHFIHATSPNLYGLLGQAASGGCNRMTYPDARELYQMTPLGTRVEVIGPEG